MFCLNHKQFRDGSAFHAINKVGESWFERVAVGIVCWLHHVREVILQINEYMSQRGQEKGS